MGLPPLTKIFFPSFCLGALLFYLSLIHFKLASFTLSLRNHFETVAYLANFRSRLWAKNETTDDVVHSVPEVTERKVSMPD